MSGGEAGGRASVVEKGGGGRGAVGLGRAHGGGGSGAPTLVAFGARMAAAAGDTGDLSAEGGSHYVALGVIRVDGGRLAFGVPGAAGEGGGVQRRGHHVLVVGGGCLAPQSAKAGGGKQAHQEAASEHTRRTRA
jgi:hypothetical protein